MKRETTLDNGQTNFHSLHLTTDFMYKLGCASETSFASWASPWENWLDVQ